MNDYDHLWLNMPAKRSFVWLALSLIDRGLVTVDRPASADRRLLKLSFLAPYQRLGEFKYREPGAGLAGWPLEIHLGAWQPRSTHVEIEVPSGLEIQRPGLEGVIRGELIREERNPKAGTRPERVVYTGSFPAPQAPLISGGGGSYQVTRGVRTHVYVDQPDLAYQMRVWCDVWTTRSGFVSAAAWITAIIAVVFVIVMIGLPTIRKHTEAGGALLLALPALGGAVVTRTGHAMTQMMLTTLRRAVELASLLAVVGCALLVVSSNGHSGKHAKGFGAELWAFLKDRWPWLLFVVFSIWIALFAISAYLRRCLPTDSPNVPRTYRVMEVMTNPLVRLLAWPRI